MNELRYTLLFGYKACNVACLIRPAGTVLAEITRVCEPIERETEYGVNKDGEGSGDASSASRAASWGAEKPLYKVICLKLRVRRSELTT